ncbi:Oxygen-evolving enhancer protein [Gracilaria domingensis]|nr:Oxygen-evolving enhancer protein [Gracilaria domingensis]
MAPPAFVTGAPLVPRSSFCGKSMPACSQTARPAITMSQAPVSRRQALMGGAALLAAVGLSPFATLAKSGDSPKISVFGVGGASSPFDAGVPTGGKVQYKPFGDEEVAVFKRIVDDSKERLVGSVGSIKEKNWEDIRSQIRLQSDLRKTQLTINANMPDKKSGDQAKKAYLAFKTDIEKLDQACVQKDQARAYKAYNAALKSLAAWQDTTGY